MRCRFTILARKDEPTPDYARRSLATVIKVLFDMPSELIEEGFRTLAEDRSFSPKMREKFQAVLEKRLFGDHGW